MLELHRLRTDKDAIATALAKRGWGSDRLAILDEIITIDDQRKALQTENDAYLAERNSLSKEIGQLFKSGKQEEAAAAKAKVETLKTKISETEAKLSESQSQLEAKLLDVPNAPHSSVPNGQSDEDNEVAKPWREDLPDLGAEALPHWELATKYNILDMKLGVKITGAGFPVFRGKGSRLQRALINFFLDEASAAGYEEIVPPLLVNESSARATGQLPDKDGQMYYVERDDLYLIPTAEVPVTNIYRDVIVKETDFPIKLTGYTQCFRREAGSYGADVKGLNRVHQFDKVEIVQFQHPDKSYETLDAMVAHVEGLLDKLELPYRILRLCGGDLSATSALTYDLEVYSAGQKRWLEVSSVSNFETYQANRLKLRFKDKDGKKRLAHTLNGSALALARIIAALLENNQTADGIKIPEVLQKYTGFAMID
jgi:seryl-tRNA synthetase